MSDLRNDSVEIQHTRDIAALGARMGAVESSLGDLKNDYREVRDLAQDTNFHVKSLAETMERVEQSISGMHEQMERQNDRLDGHSDEVANLSTRVSALEPDGDDPAPAALSPQWWTSIINETLIKVLKTGAYAAAIFVCYLIAQSQGYIGGANDESTERQRVDPAPIRRDTGVPIRPDTPGVQLPESD